jgi:DNA-binding NarL/FixJ family response regulator
MAGAHCGGQRSDIVEKQKAGRAAWCETGRPKHSSRIRAGWPVSTGSHECVGDLVERVRRRAPAPPPPVSFTPRQLDIVSAIVAGGTNRDIAKQFSITPTTVKYHLTHMFEKVGVSNRIELARFALQHRIESSQPRH